MSIEPGGRYAESEDAEAHISQLAATSENIVVAFIHVILVQQHIVNRRGDRGNRFGVTFIGMAITPPG